ncbi:Down syndrome cell adhesion molecule-like protein Dscam2 [Tetranychus urticae]|uniref:Down syndrome cell adhesion molecule-like protein Dscam2 n=1 Tax=Tetranychus urticae TaxID=32264 RepID=UPI000D6520AB|nr:Down syndrome cell adhesion molecule-like protein Dscam2 [Tetranychus urticae]
MIIQLLTFLVLISALNCQKSPKAQLSFLLKPKIGGKTTVACMVDDGEPPFEFNWFKDEQKIQHDSTIHIDKLRDSSILTIEQMSSSHNGKYTCNVKNMYGSDTPAIEIAVEGPPSWKFKQQDIKSKPNENVILKCSATGHPKPKVIWKKFENLKWVTLGDDKLIGKISDDEIRVSNLHKKHEGKYGCEVSNGFGPNLWNEFNIDIIAPKAGQISSISKPKEGGVATFACATESGDKPIHFKWFKDAQPIENSETIRIESLTRDSSVLIIDPITVKHNGNYTCVLSNNFGKDSSSIQISIESPPRWKNKPSQSYKVRSNSAFNVSCSGEGFPQTRSEWKKFTGTSWEPLNHDLIKTTQSEMNILKSTKLLSGRYGCEVSNGIEPKLWSEFEIFITGNKV